MGYLKMLFRDFPGGAVVNNSPVNAGDTGSIPGPGRSQTMLRSSKARVPQLLSPRAARTPRAHAPQQEKPTHHNEE